MNIRSFRVLPLGLLMVACAPAPLMPDQSASFANCIESKPSRNCSSAPQITLNLNSHKATPNNYCASPGDTIVFKVVPNPPGSDVATVGTLPKDGTSIWLVGKNDPDAGTFEITVSDNPKVFNDYFIIFADGVCVDPRISITD